MCLQSSATLPPLPSPAGSRKPAGTSNRQRHLCDAAFTTIDTNKDGEISAHELKVHLRDSNDLHLQSYTDEQINKLIHDQLEWEHVAATLKKKYDYDAFWDSLPSEVKEKVKAFDRDKDGQFDLSEVANILDAYMGAEKQLKWWRHTAVLALAAIALLIISTFFSAAVANEWSKEMHVEDDGTVVADDGSVLQTASKMTEMELTSKIPNKHLSQLTSFSYIDPDSGASMSVAVESFVRVPEQFAHCGSVVVLQTSLGMQVLLLIAMTALLSDPACFSERKLHSRRHGPVPLRARAMGRSVRNIHYWRASPNARARQRPPSAWRFHRSSSVPIP